MTEKLDTIDAFDPTDELNDSDIPEVDIYRISLEGESTVELSPLSLPTAEEFAAKTLEIAKSYIGVSRADNLPQVAKFLSLFDLPTKIDGKWVPFCAAGVSYSAAKAYCELNLIPFSADNSVAVFKKVLPMIHNLYFLPSPSCWQIKADAVKRGRWQELSSPANIQPGWFVEYNWKGGTVPEHIGIVEFEKLVDHSLHTVEFNTSGTVNGNQRDGGVVAEKVRPFTNVVGFIRVYQ